MLVSVKALLSISKNNPKVTVQSSLFNESLTSGLCISHSPFTGSEHLTLMDEWLTLSKSSVPA